MDEQYFTVKEIAKRLRFRDRKIREEIQAQRLHALLIGGQYRISAKDLADWMRLMGTAPSEENKPEQVAC